MAGRLGRAVVAAAAALAGAGAGAAPAGSPWGAGFFPDVPLTAQDGRTFRFYSDLVRDRHVVIDFVFTRCRQACPLATANLARVQRLLGARVGRDLFFYSISLDPEHDGPEALRRYAEAYHAGPGWLFLTGRREDVERLRTRLGDRGTLEDHAVFLQLGNDPAGQWTTLSAVDDPGFLAAQIDAWMTSDWRRHAPVASYAEAPRPAAGSEGARLYRQRCAACHEPGPGGERTAADLRGVTRRRDRAWLQRWLASPERLLAERDPIALELAARHPGVSMPSLKLREAQVTALLDYLAASGEGRE
jgi:protein SCO1/2